MNKRSFHLVEGTSSKFWEVEVDSGALIVRFGRIGTNGQTQRKDLGPDASANAAKLIAEKMRKGYVEVGAVTSGEALGGDGDSNPAADDAAPNEAEADTFAELEERMAENRPKPLERTARPSSAAGPTMSEAEGAEGFDGIIMNGDPSVFTEGSVAALEQQLGTRFPAGYRTFVTKIGNGLYGGRVRVYMPDRILAELADWRDRIAQHWFWGEAPLSQEAALQAICVADTVDGDELVFHPSNPDRIYILPRHSERSRSAGTGFAAALRKFVRKQPATIDCR